MMSQFADMTSSPSSFDVVLFLMSSLVTGPLFHVNMVIASGVMTIFFYKGLTGNQKYPYLSFAQYLETGVS